MFEKALIIPSCCGFVTVVPEIGGSFTVSSEIAEKAGLKGGVAQLHVFQDSRGRNFVLNGVHLFLVPHPWKKREVRGYS
jgi:hypothetical protein